MTREQEQNGTAANEPRVQFKFLAVGGEPPALKDFAVGTPVGEIIRQLGFPGREVTIDGKIVAQDYRIQPTDAGKAMVIRAGLAAGNSK